MNRIIWGVALAAIMVWSLLTWGSYVLVTQGSEWLAGAGAVFALPQEWQFGLEWSLRLVEQFGVALLWVLWGMVVVTLFGAWLVTWLVGAAAREPARPALAAAQVGYPTSTSIVANDADPSRRSTR